MTSQQPRKEEAPEDTPRDRDDSSANTTPTLYHRFVRLNPFYDRGETLRLLEQELAAFSYSAQEKDVTSSSHDHQNDKAAPTTDYPRHVTWIPGASEFYALPASFPLMQSRCYQDGRVYGQDVSSGAAVAAVLQDLSHDKNCQEESSPRDDLRILDLCCAPGQKLLALADGVRGNKNCDGIRNNIERTTIVGVDVSADRLAVCQKALRKYYSSMNTTTTTTTTGGAEATNTAKDKAPSGVTSCNTAADKQQSTTLTATNERSPPRIRLYCTDGTTFGQDVNHRLRLAWDSVVAQQDVATARRRLNKSARKRQAQRLRGVAAWDWKVDTHPDRDDQPKIELFDAVLVDAECSTDGSIKHVQKRRRLESAWTEDRLDELVDLQRRLAAAGFRLLRPGGIMVYATCSMSRDQNEGVMRWLLREMGSQAQLVPVSFPGAPPSVSNGEMDGTLRFQPSQDPRELTGDGFFLAKIQKKACHRNWPL